MWPTNNSSVCLHQKKVDMQSASARLSSTIDEREEEETVDLLVLLSPASPPHGERRHVSERNKTVPDDQ